MEFDKSKVYTALNADEVKPGSRVFVADNLTALKRKVKENLLEDLFTLNKVLSAESSYRFRTENTDFMLCYLVSEPEGLHWTKLKIGDVIQNASKGKVRQVTGLDSFDKDCHIFAGEWLSDKELANDWEKVED